MRQYAPLQRKPKSPAMPTATVPASITPRRRACPPKSAQGQPLSGATRSYFEPRLGRDLSGVRLHTGQQSAQLTHSLDARAVTVGRNVFFAPGQFQPQTTEGAKLLAHELVHTLQPVREGLPRTLSAPSDAAEAEAHNAAEQLVHKPQSSRPPRVRESRAAYARQTWGTAQSTAPIAKSSPQQDLLGELTSENARFENARRILIWIESKRNSASGFTVRADDLYTDASLVKQLNPKPLGPEDLEATLSLMVHHGVLRPVDVQRSYRRSGWVEPSTTDFSPVLDEGTQGIARKQFDTAWSKLKQFRIDFEKRIAKKDPLAPVIGTELVPQSLSSDRGQIQAENKESSEVARLQSALDALPQNDPGRTKMTRDLDAAKARLSQKQRYRTFARPVTRFLGRLQATNGSFSVGTYVGHSWGEFSVDIFLKAPLERGGFWKLATAQQFIDDLNRVAESDDTICGKFAWRAIYNDSDLALATNQQYGQGRVITGVPGHGPDKLHIHLDLKPMTLTTDDTTGFAINDPGRIELLGEP